MKVHLEIDDKHEGISVIIRAKEWSDELETLMKCLKNSNRERLLGSVGDQSILLDPNDVDYVFAKNRKVYAMWNGQQVELKAKLYEVEKMLEPYRFARFSKSVIGNLQSLEKFELSFNGTLCVFFKSGNKEYVSRNYVSALKQKLLIGGNSGDI